MASNPPSSAKRSERTSITVLETKNTSRTESCCSWSSSPGSMPACGTPKRSIAMPTSRRMSGWSYSTSFGPMMAALERKASSTRRRMAEGSRTTSSWQKSRKVAPLTTSITSLAAAGKLAASGSLRTKAPGRTLATRAVGSTTDPASSTSTVTPG